MKISIEDIDRIAKEAIEDGDFENVVSGSSFKDQGLDSLDVSTLFLAINDEYGVEIPDEDYDSITTPDVLITYLADK
ncbi:phosphopantetheine-binding protein [Opitutales bacterium]|nr:phosphopantetheine-binding protein [Opitutales bacterium]MDB2681515.1 phosphopantetheine-binding protein [Opitutales bacterium]